MSAGLRGGGGRLGGLRSVWGGGGVWVCGCRGRAGGSPPPEAFPHRQRRRKKRAGGAFGSGAPG